MLDDPRWSTYLADGCTPTAFNAGVVGGIQQFCCDAGADCSETVPSECSTTCSKFYQPFYTACKEHARQLPTGVLLDVELDEKLDELYALCAYPSCSADVYGEVRRRCRPLYVAQYAAPSCATQH